jgi:hypothetical protein
MISLSIQTGPNPHPASCTTVTGSLSWQVKQVGHEADHPHPSCAKVENGVELYLHIPSVPACHGTYTAIMCHKIILISLPCLCSRESVSCARMSFKCVAAEKD